MPLTWSRCGFPGEPYLPQGDTSRGVNTNYRNASETVIWASVREEQGGLDWGRIAYRRRPSRGGLRAEIAVDH